jgi:uncharacterized coiled-coil DUF342 family protein
MVIFMDNRLPELGGVSRQMRSIQEQIDSDYQKLNKLRDRRSELIEQLEKLRDSANSNKTARDEKNTVIAEKKALRDKLHKEKAETSEKIKELIAKKKSLLASTDYDESDLLSQLKEISWRYQTTTLTLDEDRKAVQKISELEKRLVFFKKVREVDQEIDRNRSKFDELKTQANTVHSEIVSLAEESMKYHEALMKSYEERDKLVAELEEVKSGIASLRETIGKSKDELFATSAQFKAIQNMAMQQRAQVLANQAKLLINKRTELAEKATEKLKNKERMTFEEFAAMLETKGIAT